MNEPGSIVICGSMSSFDEMLHYKELLGQNYIPSIVPHNEKVLIERLSAEEFSTFKRSVSAQHLRKIREKNVFGILVVNAPKNGISNYIGANTFAEIAMAFCWNRKIFILHDLYDFFRDELIAWQATILHGDLNQLFSIYNGEGYPQPRQLRLSTLGEL